MEDDHPPLTVNEALDVLAGCLDAQRDCLDRYAALNDARVPDSLVLALLSTLEPTERTWALAWCDRFAVLDAWASVGTEDERGVIAGNDAASSVTLCRLVADDSHEVRCQLAFNSSAGLDIVAWLLADPSLLVQEALSHAFASTSDDYVDIDDEAGDDDSLTFLYEMVPAAEAEDLIEEWEEDRVRESDDRMVRETQLADWLDVHAGLADNGAENDDEDGEGAWSPPSTTQALALLRQILGAEQM